MKDTVKRVLLILALMAVAAAAANLSDVGTGAKEELQGFLKSLKWIFAIAGVGVPLASMGWAWNKISEKEETSQGQQEPKFMRIFKVVAAGFVGLAAMFIIYGSLSVTLLDKGFSEGWSIFVSDFFKTIFT